MEFSNYVITELRPIGVVRFHSDTSMYDIEDEIVVNRTQIQRHRSHHFIHEKNDATKMP